MCGIAGIITTNKSKKDIIKKMSDAIKHRGPDKDGYFIDEFIALAHRRLSIIDLSNGLQPMFNENKNIVTIFNGEIYNYLELKKELIELGHTFKTNSDTEVLVHGYEEWNISLPKHLRGMFAFAIYNTDTKELFLARDNFGIKPLYYANMNDTFMFASEIKAFLDVPMFDKVFNESILPTYLEFSFVPTEETFFKGVYRLDAGSYLIFKDNKITIDKYYKIDFNELDITLEEAVNNIGSVIKNSVEKHLISDVEVGSFLSSGIDSSLIVSLAKPNKTYTIGYNESKYDESSYASDLANKLGIENKIKIIDKKEYFQKIPHIMYMLDEPTADPAAISLYFVAREASKDVKVILSGEGADEFFGGYNYYKEEINFKFYNKIPFIIRYIIGKIASLFPEKRGINFLVRRGERLEKSYIGVNRNFSEKLAKKVLKKEYNIKAIDVCSDVYKEFKDKSNIDKMQAIDINFWLMKDILLKADRMTMANSLEGRVPFIDKEVFKVASSLPFKYKVTKENTKFALRKYAKEVIPTSAYKKKKLGFPVPIRDWIKEDDIAKIIREDFNGDIANKYFNVSLINKFLDNHIKGKEDNYRKIWTIYTFIEWYKIYFHS